MPGRPVPDPRVPERRCLPAGVTTGAWAGGAGSAGASTPGSSTDGGVTAGVSTGGVIVAGPRPRRRAALGDVIRERERQHGSHREQQHEQHAGSTSCRSCTGVSIGRVVHEEVGRAPSRAFDLRHVGAPVRWGSLADKAVRPRIGLVFAVGARTRARLAIDASMAMHRMCTRTTNTSIFLKGSNAHRALPDTKGSNASAGTLGGSLRVVPTARCAICDASFFNDVLVTTAFCHKVFGTERVTRALEE